MNVKSKVIKLAKRFNSTEPSTIMEGLGVELIEDERLTSTLAYHIYVLRVPVIVLSSHVPEHMRRYILAHELGHVILHRGTNTQYMKASTMFSVDRVEIQADTFAVELLLPDSVVLEHPGYTLEQLARLQGLPPELVHLKGAM